MKIFCSVGGGYSSTALMPRVIEKDPNYNNVEYINCGLPNEHPDMWNLFDAVEKNLGIKIRHIAYAPEEKQKWKYVTRQSLRDGNKEAKTPFDIFMKESFLANSRLDTCSRVLKRETIKNYVTSNYKLDELSMLVGIHAQEIERTVSIRENWESLGVKVVFPLLEQAHLTSEEQAKQIKEWYGVSVDMYEKGFEHHNCHGACVKAGQRQWAMLWYYYPSIYEEWELNELTWQKKTGNTNAIMRKTTNGKKAYITLKEFRESYIRPAFEANGDGGFLSRFIANLPGNPGCFYCEAI